MANLDWGRSNFNGENLGGGTHRSEIIDGVMVGAYVLAPLPAETGEIQLAVRRIGPVSGHWDLHFPASRAALTAQTQVVLVSRSFDVPGGVLTIKRLLLSPFETQVEVEVAHQDQSPSLNLPELSIATANGPVKGKGGSGRSSRSGDVLVESIRMLFDPLDRYPASVTLRLGGMVFRSGETRVPLSGPRVAVTSYGNTITVEALENTGQNGRATLREESDSHDAWWQDFSSWQVLDDAGQLHPAQPPQEQSSTMEAVRLQPGKSTVAINQQRVGWTLPRGRTAVALVNHGYWEHVENLGEVTIELPQR
ncbi:MAG TPA: hypothetical protein VGK74_16785 [Symbiobacteriaceae bacterium]